MEKHFDLIIICGAPASGKMTVGQSLEKHLGHKLFFNHMSLELVNQFFDFGTANFEALDHKIRFDIFQAVADSDLGGLIFTIVWDYNLPEDEEYIDDIIDIFSKKDLNTCIVELNCEIEERYARNRHENRLKHKPSKRNIEFSDGLIRDAEERFRMISKEGEFKKKPIFKIDNTHLSVEETALEIIKHFKLA